MIVSAVRLWQKLNTESVRLSADEKPVERVDCYESEVRFDGRSVKDGTVKIFARFFRPKAERVYPTVMLFVESEKDVQCVRLLLKNGYAVLVPDFFGKTERESVSDGDAKYTVYPSSLSYANYDKETLYACKEENPEKTCWFEWTHVSLCCIRYLQSRSDVGNVGVFGVGVGGEIAWKTMLSPEIKCGVAVNAVGWHGYEDGAQEGALTSEKRCFVAGIDSQSYAPFVKCPSLIVCSMRREGFSYERAYDTFARVGIKDGSAIVYSVNDGGSLNANAWTDILLFLGCNLAERQIFIPTAVDLTMTETGEDLLVEAQIDTEGIIEEANIYYTDANKNTLPAHRLWHVGKTTSGKGIKDGKFSCVLKPFGGENEVYAFAQVKFINGFTTVSKIVQKTPKKAGGKISRVLYSGVEDVFEEKAYTGSVLDRAHKKPAQEKGYGNITGVNVSGGVKTYLITSPAYKAPEGTALQFDAYAPKTTDLVVEIELYFDGKSRIFRAETPVKGGGKWKRILLEQADFKDVETGVSLKDLSNATALYFENADGEKTLVTNVLWL